MTQDDEERLPQWIGRFAGFMLAVAGSGGVWALWIGWVDLASTGKIGSRLAFFLLAVLIAVLAIIQGVRLLLAPSGSEVFLTRPMLILGVMLFLVAGLTQTLFAILDRNVESMLSALGYGIGGAIGAFRLFKTRHQTAR